MLKVSDRIWIGDSADESHGDLLMPNIRCILNVAQDLHPTRGWMNGIEYMHVGLIDGPGNELTAYYAAVIALHTLLKRGKVLVCCHDKGRSLAIVTIYLYLSSGHNWDTQMAILRERYDDVSDPHIEHRKAYGRINWGSLINLLKD